MINAHQTKEKSIGDTNTWRLNNAFLNKQQSTEEIKREINKFLETSSKIEKLSTTILNTSVKRQDLSK